MNTGLLLATFLVTGVAGQAAPPCGTLTPGAPTFERMVEFTGGDPCEVETFRINVQGTMVRLTRSFLFGARTPVSSRLNAFCKIEKEVARDPWPTPTDIERKIAERNPGLTPTVGPDWDGLVLPTSQAGDYPEDIWRYHAGRYLHHVRAVAAVGSLATAAVKPRLAIIDSAPTRTQRGWTATLPRAAEENHGVALARMAETILCDGGDANGVCAAEVVSYQAIENRPNATKRGSLGQLATAVVDAVDEAPAPRRLIINLSLGWYNDHFGGEHGDIFAHPDETPAAAAAFEALKYARCQDAGILAAAGNRVGAEDQCLEDKATFPARWMNDGHRVNGNMCFMHFGSSGLPPWATRTLLSTAGAVTDADGLMGAHREASAPTFVANGMGVVSPTSSSVSSSGPQDSGRPTAVLFGTSGPTVVASSAVALVLQVRPELSGGMAETTVDRNAPQKVGSGSLIKIEPLLSNLGVTGLGLRVPFAPVFPQASNPKMQPIGGFHVQCDLPSGDDFMVVSSSMLDATVCDQLRATSVDEEPALHPQPLPDGGGCPSGCQVLLLEDTAYYSTDTSTASEEAAASGPVALAPNARAIAKLRLDRSAPTEGRAVVPNPASASSTTLFKPAFVEVKSRVTGARTYYQLPDTVSSSGQYYFELEDADVDPSASTVRIIVRNDQTNALAATEVYSINLDAP